MTLNEPNSLKERFDKCNIKIKTKNKNIIYAQRYHGHNEKQSTHWNMKIAKLQSCAFSLQEIN